MPLYRYLQQRMYYGALEHAVPKYIPFGNIDNTIIRMIDRAERDFYTIIFTDWYTRMIMDLW